MTLYDALIEKNLFPSDEDVVDKVVKGAGNIFYECGASNFWGIELPKRDDGLHTLPMVELPPTMRMPIKCTK